MTERNPMEGYRDIFPWPYEWSRDIAAPPISWLTSSKFLYDDVDIWTYANHWHGGFAWEPLPASWITDLYWSDSQGDRLQLPPQVGHHLARHLVAWQGGRIRRLIWWGRVWRPSTGWLPWDGEQGDFVDHIHIEWDKEKYDAESQG